jgi:formylglycine-generating enzyme required for sulfatase activity
MTHDITSPPLIDAVRKDVRGGSWNNNPQNLRAANRNRNTTDNRNNNLGFRVWSTLSARAGAINAPGAH